MFKRLKKFLATDRQRKKLFLEAFSLLGKAWVSLKRRPFKELISDLNLEPGEVASVSLDPAQLNTVKSTSWAIRVAASVTPWESTCLVQVLAAQKMLERRGVAGIFYLGASPERENGNVIGLSAHAWLKCGSEFVTGESGHEKYSVVSSFSWSA